MKSIFSTLLVAGWFFAFEHPYYGKASVRGIFGPFDTKVDCDGARLHVLGQFAMAGVDGKVSECKERGEI